MAKIVLIIVAIIALIGVSYVLLTQNEESGTNTIVNTANTTTNTAADESQETDTNQAVTSDSNASATTNTAFSTNTTQNANTNAAQTDWSTYLQEQTKSAHFVSSSPAHAAVLTSAPSEVVINFNFDLATNSAIAVRAENSKSAKSSGTDVTAGTTQIDANKRAMHIAIEPNMTTQLLYGVNYRACWPDQTCHDGQFAFVVDP